MYGAISAECSATFVSVCVDPFTPSASSQNAGPTAKIEGVTNSSQAAEALLTCLEALTQSPSTAGASSRRRQSFSSIGVSVLGVLVPPSLTEWLILPIEAAEVVPTAPHEVQPGVIVGATLAGVVVLGLLGAAAWYVLKKRTSETIAGVTLKRSSSTGAAVEPVDEKRRRRREEAKASTKQPADLDKKSASLGDSSV